jgi:hypothetical protein
VPGIKIVSLATRLLKRSGAKSRGLPSFGRYFNFQLLCNTEALPSEPMAAPDRLFREMSRHSLSLNQSSAMALPVPPFQKPQLSSADTAGVYGI